MANQNLQGNSPENRQPNLKIKPLYKSFAGNLKINVNTTVSKHNDLSNNNSGSNNHLVQSNQRKLPVRRAGQLNNINVVFCEQQSVLR